VILSFLRFLAFTLMFIFIYRVVVRAFRFLTGDNKKQSMSGPEPPSESRKTEAAAYLDVKDAEFKDVPPNSEKPS
jgi:hypothetical protein